MLRQTGNTLLVASVRQGMAAYSSGTYEQGSTKIDTRVINPSARRILAISHLARPRVLPACEGLISVHNQYFRQAAITLGHTLQAYGRSILRRPTLWAVRVRRSPPWFAELPPPATQKKDFLNGKAKKGSRIAPLLNVPCRLPARFRVRGTYYPTSSQSVCDLSP